MLRLFNTLTRKIEDFKPLNTIQVGYYSCGPTVYDFAHIGHARTYIFTDVLQKVLEFNGYKVKRVMNITDVGHLTSDSDVGEDKMEKGAKREGKSVWDIAAFYTEDFFEMLSKLNIKRPEIICKATDHVKEMIEMIKILEKKGFTYKIKDGIYFDTSKFPDYGKLTGQSFEKLQKTLKAGARVELVSGKKNVTDFALWKFSPPGTPRQMEWYFEGPLKGQLVTATNRLNVSEEFWSTIGFPGWHIECSTMAIKYLGETFDIHTGGVDHIPIHHTNEIAQSEAATGKSFVKYWLHADHLLVDGEKMSKSLGNFYRLSDIEKKGFSPLALRYLFLTASYRSQMNFTWKSLEAVQTAYDSLVSQLINIKSQSTERNSLSEEKLEKLDIFRRKFTEVISDDLNTAQGLAVVWEVLKSNIPPGDKYDLLMRFDEVLGLNLSVTNITQEIKIALPKSKGNLITSIPDLSGATISRVDMRELARSNKDFKKADEIKKEIEEIDKVSIKDTALGTVVKKN
ncbi:cysteine--tRNA ligase [Candidatus Gottesmanbacteria bacterium]|nr:cysteine--tRNA ligase [Candidatus Gottesmanbacteria bacterium]